MGGGEWEGDISDLGYVPRGVLVRGRGKERGKGVGGGGNGRGI